MKVTINAGGRDVTIETGAENATVADVAKEALALWQATDGAAGGTAGPAYGFGQERRGWQQSPMNMGVGPGRVDRGEPIARDGNG